MTEKATIVWFRQDLRLRDNPAFIEAAGDNRPIIPIYIWSPEEEGRWAPGGASRWWLHYSLKSLDGELAQIGSRLILRMGAAQEQLLELIRETRAETIYWNDRYEPLIQKRDRRIQKSLLKMGVLVRTFNASLLCEPSKILNSAGLPYKVFTPFWKSYLKIGDFKIAIKKVHRLIEPKRWPQSLPLSELKLLPKINWAQGIQKTWQPGSLQANKLLKHLLNSVVVDYPSKRDRPDLLATSRLSPHLHFGEISPTRIWHELRSFSVSRDKKGFLRGAEAYLRQLVWREFAYYLLHHFPKTPEEPLNPQFKRFPWKRSPRLLKAWQKGETGYPIVDAGMRELWTTGWMHNRVRLLTGSFLVKDLMIPWQNGAEWFWDTLVDADLANNTMGWQWVAGCGADAAPYFRIFNPVMQGEKFDHQGEYVRRFIPELKNISSRWIHRPWEAPAEILSQAGISLGRNYPHPIVDHREARQRALQAYDAIKRS